MRGYRGQRRLLTLPRLVVLLLLGAGGFWIMARRGKARTEAPIAARASIPVPPPPVTAPSVAPPPVAPPPPTLPPAPPTAEPERLADITALGHAVERAHTEFETLRETVVRQLSQALPLPTAGAKLRDLPYKVWLVGAVVDRVVLRSVDVRHFQTRMTRLMQDASQRLGELVHACKRNQAAAVEKHKAEFLGTSELLQTFEGDWAAFAKTAPKVSEPAAVR